MIYVLIGLVVLLVFGVLPNLLMYGTDTDLWDNIVEVALLAVISLGICGTVLYFIGRGATLVGHMLF